MKGQDEMEIFYRGKHSKIRWWEFWKKADKEHKEETFIDEIALSEYNLFKLEFERDEIKHNKDLMSEMQSLDIHRFVIDCKKLLPLM